MIGTGDHDVDELQQLADTRQNGWTVRAGLACVEGPSDARRSFRVISGDGTPLAIGFRRVIEAWLKGKPVPAPEPPPPPPEPEPAKAQGSLF